jgi:glycyl-tRNA synthetase (class II)
MPPKKDGPSKKTIEKKKEKMAEDKTFGLKNKNKSKAVQKYVAQVQHQIKGTSEAAERKKMEEKKKAAQAKEMMEKQMKELFVAAIVQPKVGIIRLIVHMLHNALCF